MTNSDNQKLNEILEKMEVCLMSSYDDKEEIHTRPMAILRKKDSTQPCVYFYMKNSSQVSHELKLKDDVRLSFMDQNTHHYASFKGESSVEENKELKKELWTSAMKNWFPDGVDDPELELVEVRLKEAHIWDSSGAQVINLENQSLNISASPSANESSSQQIGS